MSDEFEKIIKKEEETPENLTKNENEISDYRCPNCNNIILTEEKGHCTTCQHLEE